jgi:hypothetical protein
LWLRSCAFTLTTALSTSENSIFSQALSAAMLPDHEALGADDGMRMMAASSTAAVLE